MKTKVILCIFSLVMTVSFAQESPLSIEANEPDLLEYDVLMHTYKPFYFRNLKYQLSDASLFTISATLDTGIVVPRDVFNNGNRIYIFTPGVFLSYRFRQLPKVNVYGSLGFSNFLTSGAENSIESTVETKLGMGMDMTPKLKVFAEYSFMKMLNHTTKSNVSTTPSSNVFRLGSFFRF